MSRTFRFLVAQLISMFQRMYGPNWLPKVIRSFMLAKQEEANPKGYGILEQRRFKLALMFVSSRQIPKVFLLQLSCPATEWGYVSLNVFLQVSEPVPNITGVPVPAPHSISVPATVFPDYHEPVDDDPNDHVNEQILHNDHEEALGPYSTTSSYVT